MVWDDVKETSIIRYYNLFNAAIFLFFSSFLFIFFFLQVGGGSFGGYNPNLDYVMLLIGQELKLEEAIGKGTSNMLL